MGHSTIMKLRASKGSTCSHGASTAAIGSMHALTVGVRDEIRKRRPLADRVHYCPRHTAFCRLSEPWSGSGHKPPVSLSLLRESQLELRRERGGEREREWERGGN